MPRPIRSMVTAAALVLALPVQAEICLQNNTDRNVRIIQAESFDGGAGGPMTMTGRVDKRVISPQQEYCIPTSDPDYQNARRFAFELVPDINDVQRRRNGTHFNVTQKPLPLDARLSIKGTVEAPRAVVTSNFRRYNFGKLIKIVSVD
ncbi:exported hypothetical protein [Thiocapsa sp. KS1]|nr:hypothetical protein [Thiocapsa sp. KS1]CRI66445.1 exported hypothetical protein [Thiocapsa sp. KS1]